MPSPSPRTGSDAATAEVATDDRPLAQAATLGEPPTRFVEWLASTPPFAPAPAAPPELTPEVAAETARNALLDGIESGDLDPNGDPIPHERYP